MALSCAPCCPAPHRRTIPGDGSRKGSRNGRAAGLWAAVGTAKLETAGSREVSGNTEPRGGPILHQGRSRQPFQPQRSWSGRQGDERSDSPLGESRVAPFPCIGMMLRSGVATSLPWRSLHPVPETQRELGRSQGTFWEELLMTVSSTPPPAPPASKSRDLGTGLQVAQERRTGWSF